MQIKEDWVNVVGEEFGVTEQNIHVIRKDKGWLHVTSKLSANNRFERKAYNA